MNNIIKRVWNQNRLVNIEDLTGMVFQAEADGHTFEIRGIDDTGAAVELSGTVSGVFRRPDNADIALTGSASDGVVSVTLSEDCYAVPGRFGLTIFVTSNSQKVAVYACVGTVAVSSTGNVAGDTPANVEDLIDDINAAIADLNTAIGSIPADYSQFMAAIAPAYSSSALYAVGSYAWHDGTLYRCTTSITTAESWTAGHWTAAVLGDDVSDLRTEINNIIDDNYNSVTVEKDIYINSSRNSGYVDIYGTVQTNASYVYSQKISVGEGDTITGSGLDTSYNVQTVLAMQRICAYSNGVAVSSAGVSSYVLTYTVPAGVDEIIVSYLATMTDVVIKRHVLNYVERTPKVDELEEAVNILTNKETDTTVTSLNPTIVNGKFINLSGAEQTNAGYYYFNVEDLSEGDVISVRSFYGQSTSIVIPYLRYVCAFDSVGSAQQSKGIENALGTYTVPQGITKVSVSIAANYPLADGVLVYRNTDVTDIKVNENLNSAVFASYPQSVSGNMSASSSLTLTANSVKKNKQILFNAKISAFNKITIGQGTNDLNSARYEIDDTNVTYYRGTASTGVVHPHGLTFADYISVTVSVNDEHIPTITVMTNGGMFTVTESATWVGCMPNVYINTDANTTLSACVLSFVCDDTAEPLWIFGDSYVSYTADRWTYYISHMGYNKYLLNGYSGEEAAHGMEDFRNLLNYGVPKYIVWALGMNNADLADQVDLVWNAVYNELKAICAEKKITLILCTIPNVPNRSHTYKNSIIMNSGYKYINFADAVGALNDSTWYTGMLSNDNLHPSVEGGKALAAEVLKDLPYICIE